MNVEYVSDSELRCDVAEGVGPGDVVVTIHDGLLTRCVCVCVCIAMHICVCVCMCVCVCVDAYVAEAISGHP